MPSFSFRRHKSSSTSKQNQHHYHHHQYAASSLRSHNHGVGAVTAAANAATAKDDTKTPSINDGPVTAFIDTIATLPVEEWRARTIAFETLVDTIPPSSNDDEEESSASSKSWHLSPPTLRRLGPPLTTLLTDPRSSVVKNTTITFVTLINQSKDHARFLLKDLLPTILSLHAQTVNVIRSYALDMMLRVIPQCKFRSGLPVVLERMKRDKSRDVREACARYVRCVLDSWSTDYVGQDVAKHLGYGLIKGLYDPSQKVRMECRVGFESLRIKYPKVWDYLVNKEGGIVDQDLKLKRMLLNMAEQNDQHQHHHAGVAQQHGHSAGAAGAGTGAGHLYDDEEMSMGSIGSYTSRGSMRSRGSTTVLSFQSYRTGGGAGGSIGGVTSGSVRSGRHARSGGAGASSVGGGSSRGRGVQQHSSSYMASTVASRTAISSRGRPSPEHNTTDIHTGSSTPGTISRFGFRSNVASGNTPSARTTVLSSPTSRRDLNGKGDDIKQLTINTGDVSSGEGGGGKVTAFPFAEAIKTPPRTDTPGIPMSNQSQQHTADTAEEDVRVRAAVAIQAAARGVSVRRSILPQDAKEEKSTTKQPSVEMEMIQKARQAIHLGTTAEQMARRRKTMTGSRKASIVPVPPTPAGISTGDDSTFASFASPTHERYAKHSYGSPLSRSLSPSMSSKIARHSPSMIPSPRDWRGRPPRSPTDESSAGGSGSSRSGVDRRSRTLENRGAEVQNDEHDMLISPSNSTTEPPSASVATTTYSTNDLRKRARDRKSSLALQQRLRQSISSGALRQQDEHQHQQRDGTVPQQSQQTQQAKHLPEHIRIGHDLLDAHRHHVDALMKTLRMEMDVIRDFELLLAETTNGEHTKGGDDNVERGNEQHEKQQHKHPTEEEVLDYFESVALCLDQRMEDGERMLVVLDKISRGDDDDDDDRDEGGSSTNHVKERGGAETAGMNGNGNR